MLKIHPPHSRDLGGWVLCVLRGFLCSNDQKVLSAKMPSGNIFHTDGVTIFGQLYKDTMHDFSCTNANDMHNKVLADRVRYFKEDERGVAIMCREMEIMRNQAHEEGVEIGIKKGRMLQLIKQVCAKMQKFSSAEEIANDLVEQDVPLIQKIMDVAPNFSPDYNVDAIYKALNL